ncbi:hypothetical protein HYPSUDRAFT_204505 [Hypholoma sublateritium FD-334 SS-4]|uniref:Uncharacterized protein n=1 Tax=Hypholoma sublateritium (strain FD-334 SS-4) TaxID=945553 RepID=A0A0D2M828_HYPSF|nr:hypothetical protein HYPSUDRAFT_204505 [Hypholoma sublateritium FD-334 SS-4]
MPIGPILQALWRDPESARRFNYRRSKTQEIIETLHSNSGKLPAYDDFFHGSDYLEHTVPSSTHTKRQTAGSISG